MTLLEEYLLYISDKSDDTQKAYKRILTAFIEHLDTLGMIPCGDELTSEQTMESVIAQYVDQLHRKLKNGERKKITPASKRTYLSTISSFYIWMIDIKKKTNSNPAITVLRMKKLKSSPIGPNIQESELKSIFDVLSKPKIRKRRYSEMMRKRDQCIIHIAASCGLRRIEIHRLDIRSYDKDRQVLSVLGKGNKLRTIPVPDIASEILSNYIDKIRILFPSPVKGDEFSMFFRPIYEKETNKEYSIRMPKDNITDRIRKIMEEAGIYKGKGPHTLRRSYGAWLLNDTGGQLRIVQEILGHSNISTTERYTALSNKHTEDQAREKFRERGL